MLPILLRAANLTFAYADAPVLREISLSLTAGEFVALIGPNGSGKSTAIQTLLGHHRAAGDIFWQDRSISRWRPRALARLAAYLPQSPTFEPGQTVGDVLRMGRAPYWGAFGLESQRDAQVVADVADRLGLGGLLDRPIETLSGGQRQRVLIGRCLAQEPRALLLDEPNTFLDLRHQAELASLLRGLARPGNIGVLMACHDLHFAAVADRIVVLHEGRIAADGLPDHVLTPEVLQPIYGVPLARVQAGNAVAIIPLYSQPAVEPRPAENQK